MDNHNYYTSASDEDLLGKGAYGKVFKGKSKYFEDETVAIKRIDNDKRESVAPFFTSAKREAEIVSVLAGHKNIVKLLDIYQDENHIWLVYEFCDLGDLKKYLESGHTPTIQQKVKIMQECAAGVNYMHTRVPPIVHRDIKLENILLKRTGSEIVVKIADFGFARSFNDNQMLYSDVGTLMYRAPECFVQQSERAYSYSVDIFSLGLVYLVLIKYGEGRCNTLSPEPG